MLDFVFEIGLRMVFDCVVNFLKNICFIIFIVGLDLYVEIVFFVDRFGGFC